jgi:carboxymethylenebutenolidase
LAARPNFEFHAYPNAEHGFATPLSRSYDEAASKLAWSRTVAALRRVLGS